MKAQDMLLAWGQNINNLGELLEHKEDVMNALIDFNFIKNGGEKKIAMSSTIVSDRSIYSRHLDGFEKICSIFKDVINDTVFGHYSYSIKGNYNKLYNCICYSLMIRDIERIPTESDTKKEITKIKLRYGFIDILERLYNISNNEKLSELYAKIYKNCKDNMDNFVYLSNIEECVDSIEKSPFTAFLKLKEAVRCGITRDVIFKRILFS